MSSSQPQPLVVMALKAEGGGLFECAGIPVLYTGVGKINATYALTRRLAQDIGAGRPLPLIVNCGTAGSSVLPRGSIVACGAFVQRDMDVTALDFDPGATPFDPVPARLECSFLGEELPHFTCGTGDSFATTATGVGCDLVDMEAYALAKVCWLYGAEFVAIKYVTDGADSGAGPAWQENVRRAAERFVSLYRDICRASSTAR